MKEPEQGRFQLISVDCAGFSTGRIREPALDNLDKYVSITVNLYRRKSQDGGLLHLLKLNNQHIHQLASINYIGI